MVNMHGTEILNWDGLSPLSVSVLISSILPQILAITRPLFSAALNSCQVNIQIKLVNFAFIPKN